MDHFTFRIKEISLRRPSTRKMAIERFLSSQGLSLDPGLSTYFAVYKGTEIVGGAGYDRNVIKGAAVDPEYRGEGLLNAVVSQIVTDLHRQGHGNLFVFTKPENQVTFTGLGFTPVEATDSVLLLESDRQAFPRYLESLSALRRDGITGSIVMNCNPFTKGHLFLIEQAATQCDSVLVLAVEEDLSVFPFPVRLKLMQEGTRHLPTVQIVPGGPYIISSATFPTYFLGEKSSAAAVHACLDLTIFARHIAPAAGITRRFVGEEPLSPVTGLYNQVMLSILPGYGITVTVVPRCLENGECISASTVRECIRHDEWAAVQKLVPEATYAFLRSREAEPIIQRIKAGGSQPHG